MKIAATCLVFVLGLAVTVTSTAFTLAPIDDVYLLGGSPLHVPLNGLAADGEALTFSAVSSNPMVLTSIPQGNRSLRLSVADYGDMVFELFENRVPRVTEHVIQLVEDGFYDNSDFHRVVNNFVIQGGDPTGMGGSHLGQFDDQFHVDLQHNRAGALSTAKTSTFLSSGGWVMVDDTNDSQFFITNGPARHLDYEFSIFGQLVTGDSVRNAINSVATDSNDRPLQDVVIDSAEILFDHHNGVLMLKAPEGYTGCADITVAAIDLEGHRVEQTFNVMVEPDQTDSNPFLADIPPIQTIIDTPVSFQLTAIDVEADIACFLDEETLDYYGLYVPVRAHPDLYYEVDFYTGDVMVMPTNGLVGTHPITVGTGLYEDAIDYQTVWITIVPEPSVLITALASVVTLLSLWRKSV